MDVCDGHNWAITGGLAVSSYIDGERDIGDVDVVMSLDGLGSVADQLGIPVEEAKHRDKSSMRAWTEGYARGERAGVDIEIMAGQSQMTVDEQVYRVDFPDSFFDLIVERSYAGVMVPFVPPEDVLIQKTVLGREKDLDDVEQLFLAVDIDHDRLRNLLADWGVEYESFVDRVAERLDSYPRSEIKAFLS